MADPGSNTEMKKDDPPTTEKRGPGRPPNQPPANVLANPAQSPAGSPPKPAGNATRDEKQGAPSIAAGAKVRTVADEEAGGVMITYRPDPGDNATTVWNGHTFEANKPKRINHTGMIAQARTNRFFEVEGQMPTSATGPQSENAVPTDSDGYRRYAIEWFRTVRSSAGMKARWNAEESLRQSCGVGSDDLEYLDKLYSPRMAELEKAES